MEITLKKIIHRKGWFIVSKSLALFVFLSFFILLMILSSCGNDKKPVEKEIVEMPEQMDEKVKELIAANLNFAVSKKGKLEDSLLLYQLPALSVLYKQHGFSPLWSTTQTWKPYADLLLHFIEKVKLYGLFPEDYHAGHLSIIKNLFIADSLATTDRKDAVLWSRADLLMSDALVNIIHDIKNANFMLIIL